MTSDGPARGVVHLDGHPRDGVVLRRVAGRWPATLSPRPYDLTVSVNEVLTWPRALVAVKVRT
jgi:hypothetical protein